MILTWIHSWNNLEKLMKVWCLPEFFHKNMPHEDLLFMWSTFRDSSMGTKWKWFWKTWNFDVRHNFFTEICLTNNYFSCDPHFVILAWLQSLNIFEKLMKVWCLPEFFHKNMSHEQSLFMWSTFRDSSMGTKKMFEMFVPDNSTTLWISCQ